MVVGLRIKESLKMISDKKIKAFCKDHYYCDVDDDGVRVVWEPFELHSTRDIERFIEKDVYSLKNFLKNNLNKEWDDNNNE